MIVADASVFIKLFHAEDGSDAAHALFADALVRNTEIIAPDVPRYEVLGAAIHYGAPFSTITALLDDMKAGGFQVAEPDREDLILAETIARTPAPGGGYPDLFDSIYHAMAINRRGTFVTADRRHAAKAASFGAVKLLADWKPD